MEDEDIIKAELLSLASLKGFLGLGFRVSGCYMGSVGVVYGYTWTWIYKV